MKETAIILAIETVVIALSVTAYKKNIRKLAKRREIVTVAFILSMTVTTSLAYGVPFAGLPYALFAYIISVFFLQWLVSQKVLDEAWALVKAYLQKKLK